MTNHANDINECRLYWVEAEEGFKKYDEEEEFDERFVAALFDDIDTL